jgi:hypothetical protein
MAPPKKDDPHAPKPNKMLPFIAAGLLLLGGGSFVYKLNPGGALRAESAEEKKARMEHERELEMKKKEEESRERRAKARMQRGAH